MSLEKDDIETSPTFTTDATNYKHRTTVPEFILRHDISDEDLTLVSSSNRSFVQEVMWVSLGAFLGALAPAISALEEFNSTYDNFNKWDLIECLVCFTSFVVFILMLIMRTTSNDLSKDKLQEIRDRTSKNNR